MAGLSEALSDEYEFGAGYAIRWMLYEHVDDGIDIHSEAVDHIAARDATSILDIGCGQGYFLKKIVEKNPDIYPVGLDIVSTISYAVERNRPNSFVRADANVTLPFRNDSFDVTSSMFMLYHTEDPVGVINELKRVTKPGGEIVIATSGTHNKKWHRIFEGLIAKSLAISPPERYNAAFTSEYADCLLPELFDDVEVLVDQNTFINISAEDVDPGYTASDDVYPSYIKSLKSMRQLYAAGTSPTGRLIESIIRPLIELEIAKNGVFREVVARKLYSCRNPKAKQTP